MKDQLNLNTLHESVSGVENLVWDLEKFYSELGDAVASLTERVALLESKKNETPNGACEAQSATQETA